MPVCPSCGTIAPDYMEKCPQCGGNLPPESPAPDYASGDYGTRGGRDAYGRYEDYSSFDDGYGDGAYDDGAAYEPAYSYPEPGESKTLGTGAFLGSIILMMIPVIGFIVQIIWAAGGAKNKNRRSLARAYLILSIIGALLCVGAFLLFADLIMVFIDNMMLL